MKAIQAVIKKKEAELENLFLDFSQGHRDYVDSNMELKSMQEEQSDISDTNDLYGIAVKSVETINEGVEGQEEKVKALADIDNNKSEMIKVLEVELVDLNKDLEYAEEEEEVAKIEITFLESTLSTDNINVESFSGIDNKVKIWKSDVEKFSNAVGDIASEVIADQDYSLNDGNTINGENPLISLMERIKYVFRYIEDDLDVEEQLPPTPKLKKKEVNTPALIGAFGLIGTLLFSK